MRNEDKEYYIDDAGKVYDAGTTSKRAGWVDADWQSIQSIVNPPLSAAQAAQAAQHEMRAELEWCDLMIKYIASGDSARAGGRTADQIYTYAITCRDHVTSTDGMLAVIGTAPVRPL